MILKLKNLNKNIAGNTFNNNKPNKSNARTRRLIYTSPATPSVNTSSTEVGGRDNPCPITLRHINDFTGAAWVLLGCHVQEIVKRNTRQTLGLSRDQSTHLIK